MQAVKLLLNYLLNKVHISLLWQRLAKTKFMIMFYHMFYLHGFIVWLTLIQHILACIYGPITF